MKFYFTFGMGQKGAGCYYIIKRDTAKEARRQMFDTFGTQWSMQYTSAEAAGVKKYNLRLIK